MSHRQIKIKNPQILTSPIQKPSSLQKVPKKPLSGNRIEHNNMHSQWAESFSNFPLNLLLHLCHPFHNLLLFHNLQKRVHIISTLQKKILKSLSRKILKSSFKLSFKLNISKLFFLNRQRKSHKSFIAINHIISLISDSKTLICLIAKASNPDILIRVNKKILIFFTFFKFFHRKQNLSLFI